MKQRFQTSASPRAVASVCALLVVMAAITNLSGSVLERRPQAEGLENRGQATPTGTVSRGCDFDRLEIDLSVNGTNPLRSGPNMVAAALAGGRDPRTVTAAELGHDPQFIVGYPSKLSFLQGEPVRIRYAGGEWRRGTSLASYTIVDALEGKLIKTIDVARRDHPLRFSGCVAYYNGGCRFRQQLSLGSLAAGVYYVFLTDDTGADSYPIFFIVRPAKQERHVIVVFPEYTWQAYNRFGGGSLYSIHVPDESGRLHNNEFSTTRLYSASLDRPILFDPSGTRCNWNPHSARRLFESNPSIRFDIRLDLTRVRKPAQTSLPLRRMEVCRSRDPVHWMQELYNGPEGTLPFLRELTRNGVSVSAISEHDLTTDRQILDGVRIVVLTGHHEYWTTAEYEALSEFVRSGGSIANFAGNVDAGRVNVDRRNLYFDQIGGKRPEGCRHLVPRQFDGTGVVGVHVFPGSEKLLGIAYRFAGYPLREYFYFHGDEDEMRRAGLSDIQRLETTGVRIVAPGHPVFAGTGLKNGQRWGTDSPILSVELDGAPLLPDGRLDRRFSADFPVELTVLATGSTFASNVVRSPTDVELKYYGAKNPAIFVDSRPSGAPHGGRVVSFGSISFGTMLALGDRTARRVFLNTLRYLDEQSRYQ
ncbi:MAG: N,N-dimethylformamidase beta subunit family domain-containing protein [Gammaproteobacteria bacterium]